MLEIQELPPIGTLHGVCAQSRAQPPTITLFKGWSRLTTDDHGEMQGNALQGFYSANTQFLTHYQVSVNGAPISHRLSTQVSANEWSSLGAVLRSGDSGNLPEGTLPKGSIEVRILRRVDQGWAERITLRNAGLPSRKVHFELRLCCPIRDDEFSEEMKGDQVLPWKGRIPRAMRLEDRLGLRFERDFGKRRHTPTAELTPTYGVDAPKDGERVTRALELTVRPRPGGPRCRIRMRPGKITKILVSAELKGHEELVLELDYAAIVNGVSLAPPRLESLDPLPQARATTPDDSLRVDSSNSSLNLVIGQAMTDLRTLVLPIFGKHVGSAEQFEAYNAGIPRYIGVFGRDNVVTAWQSPLFGLSRYEAVLSRIALLQGVKRDDWRDEEPGRLLHERRLSPDSETGQVNRELYYGDVTSTPFWIVALSSLYQWTGERALLDRHRDTLKHCTDWVLTRLKRGQGFIYYAPALNGREDENRNQAWKDSGDAIVDREGRIRVPPLAIAEVQGYAHQALLEAAQLFHLTGDHESHRHLREQAHALKERFNREFWVEDGQFYALALDGSRRPIAARASNIGHCLGTGILDESRIEGVVKFLLSEDMFSGWGVRTLSSKNPGYDPFSYHRGAVWPVENAFIADGMASSGFHREANRVTTAQLGVAALFQHMRLPEVLSGHSRTPETPTPGIYNFGNLLQSWSVSAIAQHLQAILGIRPRADRHEVYLDPHLPEWLEWIELRNLEVGGKKLHLRFWRESDGVTQWMPIGPTGGLTLVRGMPPVFGREPLSSAKAS